MYFIVVPGTVDVLSHVRVALEEVRFENNGVGFVGSRLIVWIVELAALNLFLSGLPFVRYGCHFWRHDDSGFELSALTEGLLSRVW